MAATAKRYLCNACDRLFNCVVYASSHMARYHNDLWSLRSPLESHCSIKNQNNGAPGPSVHYTADRCSSTSQDDIYPRLNDAENWVGLHTSVLEESRSKELSGLLERGTSEVIEESSVLTGNPIYMKRWVDALKTFETKRSKFQDSGLKTTGIWEQQADQPNFPQSPGSVYE